MGFDNQLSSMVNKLQALPKKLQHQILTRLIGSRVRLIRTAGAEFCELTPHRVHVRLKNKAKVQNHIGSIHAAGIALLAETASGFVVGMNVPSGSVPVIKSMKVDYQKRAVGDMEAVATLSEEHIQTIRSTPKGEVLVPVVVTDAEKKQPVQCEMFWAWIPKRR